MLYPGGYNASPGIQALKWRIFSPLWTFLVKKIESSIKVELLEHLRGYASFGETVVRSAELPKIQNQVPLRFPATDL